MDLYEACENGNEERVVELLVLGQDAQSPASQLRVQGIAGRTALLGACMGGQATVVRLLLGEKAIVHFTSRSEAEVVTLLKPLVLAFQQQGTRADHLFPVSMVTKDGGSDVVPMVEVQLPSQWTISPNELLQGKAHVDHFGNTPLQCISCFGCGSTVKHIDDGLEITKQLLIHGDQPNLPKRSNKWTPLHWGAYHGNYEQIAMLLNPTVHIGDGTRRFAKTQVAIPLLPDTENLFAVDIAGRRGLTLVDERNALHEQMAAKEGNEAHHEYLCWRFRLDHVQAVKLFIQDYQSNASHLTRYVSEMNARNPLYPQRKATKLVTVQDAVRYGQHLLYWAGCFGLVEEVRSLLELGLSMTPVSSSRNAEKAVVKLLLAHSSDDKDVKVSLQILYICSCEAGKRQSVLHAVATYGQVQVLKLLLDKLLDDQEQAGDATAFAGSLTTSSLSNRAKVKNNLVVPDAGDDEIVETADEREKTTACLDITDLIDSGWRDYRNETPLFHAVLYLQESAVQMFANFLCPRSLTWELQNVNVEGSLLHHVSSDASRSVLGIEHQFARPEYVMIFDSVKKKYFKETVIETLHEESLIAPSLVVTRSGFRKTSFGVSTTKREMDYIVIGATDEVLVRQAQALELKVKHRGSSIRSKYNASSPELFESFRSLQRQQVILSIIQRKINLQKHLRNGNIQTIYPLHDIMGCRNICRHWGYTDSYKRIFQPFAGNSLEQFFLERKQHQYEMLWPLLTYFGEKHAFYYAFLTFYTVWLLPIALLGAMCQMLWLIQDVNFMPPLFSIVVSIWATLLVERWKRKRSEIQTKFGHFRRNRSEETPEFYGDFQVETTTLRAKTRVDVNFPKALQLARIYMGIPLLMTMGVVAVVVFVAVKTNTAYAAAVHKAMPWLLPVFVPYVVPMMNAISMLLLDNWYTHLARALTTWENHRTVWEFESMLAIKLFWFKFLNAFISLFWIAFVDQNAVELRKQLLIIMGVRQLWTSVQQDVLPMLHVRFRWKSAGFHFRSSSSATRASQCWSLTCHEWYNAQFSEPFAVRKGQEEGCSPPPTVLAQELMYPHDFLMGKQMEVVLQFGYVTMFVSVLPMAPLFALLSNIVAMRLDVMSCTQAKRRPPFESDTEVSTFMNILEFMSFAAVAVNCAVLFFTTRSDFEKLMQVTVPSWKGKAADDMNPHTHVKELWVLLAIEHVVLGAKALLSLLINDSASWVRLDEDQTDEEEKKKRLGVPSKTMSSSSTTSASQTPKAEGWQSEGHDDRADPSKVSQVLAKQYVVALRERDEALKREQQTRKLLTESMKLTTQSEQLQVETALTGSIAKAQDSLSNDSIASKVETVDESSMTFEAQSNRNDSLGRRQCFVCYALRNVEKTSERRCLSCHIGLCTSCDEVLHLDDLGVHEPLHFRVKDVDGKSSKTMMEEEGCDPLVHPGAISSHTTLDRHSSRCQSRRGKKQWNELRRYVERFLVTKTPCGPSTGHQELSLDETLTRCCVNFRISLRYLQNHERQRSYLESSTLVEPTQSLVLTPTDGLQSTRG